MAAYGLLIDYEWCTGCRSCEMACTAEHGFPVGQCGVKVNEIGPWSFDEDEAQRWQLDYQPAFTDQCDLCAARTEVGKPPTCVKHCQAACLSYGRLEDLARHIGDKPKQALVSLV